MLNIVASEWTKLRTTASFWWTSGLMLAIPTILAAIFASADSENAFVYIPITVIMAVAMVTAVVITVQATMTVTTEYRFGIPATTYRISPVRWQVAVVKLGLYAVIAALLTFLALVLAFTLGDALAYHPANWTSNPATTRALWALPLGAAALTLFNQGIGWLVRNTAGAIVLAFGTQFVVEALVGLIPRVGEDVAKFMPFSNLYAFLFNMPTGTFTVWESLGVFAAWAAVLWIVGLVLLERRDA